MPTSTRTPHVRFTMHCGKFTNAPRADRGVRPYRTFYGVADGGCNFAIAYCRVDVGIDPYGRIALSPRMRANLPVHPARAGQGPPLRYGETWQHLKSHDPSPHQSASPTAIPTPFAPSGHFPLIGGIDPPRGSRGTSANHPYLKITAGGGQNLRQGVTKTPENVPQTAPFRLI